MHLNQHQESLLKANQVWILLEEFENIGIYQSRYRFGILCCKHTVVLYTENKRSQLIEITVLSLPVLLSLFQQEIKEGNWQGSKILDTITAPGARRCETMMISLPTGINLESLTVIPQHDNFFCWQKWEFGEIFMWMLIIKMSSLTNRSLTLPGTLCKCLQPTWKLRHLGCVSAEKRVLHTTCLKVLFPQASRPET